MNSSDSTATQSENRSEALKAYAARGPDEARAALAYEKTISVTTVPAAATYQVLLKGRNEMLTRQEAMILYRSLLTVLIGGLETPCDVIKRAVCIGFGVSMSKVDSPSRREYIVQARHAFIWLCVKAGLSRQEVAESLGKSYATILFAMREFKDKLSRDHKLQERTNELERRIKELLQ